MANVVLESFRNIYDFCITHLRQSKVSYKRFKALYERATQLKDTLHSEFWDPRSLKELETVNRGIKISEACLKTTEGYPSNKTPFRKCSTSLHIGLARNLLSH